MSGDASVGGEENGRFEARDSEQNVEGRRDVILGKSRINYKTATWLQILKDSMWHGGSVYDAWLTATSAQVGSVILTLPYTLSQMGYGYGIGLQFVYGAFGLWTVYLLSWLYSEFTTRRTRAGRTLEDGHVIQYHEIIADLVTPWAGRVVVTINMIYLVFACTLQLIACSSNIYYMDSRWNKREWLYLFGAIALGSVLIPTLHNFRIVSLLGILTTSYTSAYMTKAALHRGQISPVTHQGPKDMVQFFSGATNILFAYGSHGLAVEIMEAMWKPKDYKYAYAAAVAYTYLLTLPDSISVYWAYGDTLLTHSNAFSVLPASPYKNVAIIAMILHQLAAFMTNIMPVFFFWEKVLGIHTARKIYWLRSVSRIPIVLVIWFMALAIPFFGPINSLMGAFLTSFTVYVIPNAAFAYVFWIKKAREESNWQPQPALNWTTMFVIGGLQASFVLVVGFGFGGWASATNFIRQINSFGFFDKCYQCPKAS